VNVLKVEDANWLQANLIKDSKRLQRDDVPIEEIEHLVQAEKEREQRFQQQQKTRQTGADATAWLLDTFQKTTNSSLMDKWLDTRQAGDYT